MVSEQKQARVQRLTLLLSLVLMMSLLMSALPQMSASAVTCKFKHTVAAGDTLMYIANLYTYDWLEIANANNLQPPYVITAGVVLCIPGGVDPGLGTGTGNINTNTTKKSGADPTLDVVADFNHVYVAVENFAARTPYYVRMHHRPSNVSYRIGNFTTNKEGDWSGFFRVPKYMPRANEMTVCVKNTWTDAVSCNDYKDPMYVLPNVQYSYCFKEGR